MPRNGCNRENQGACNARLRGRSGCSRSRSKNPAGQEQFADPGSEKELLPQGKQSPAPGSAL